MSLRPCCYAHTPTLTHARSLLFLIATILGCAPVDGNSTPHLLQQTVSSPLTYLGGAPYLMPCRQSAHLYGGGLQTNSTPSSSALPPLAGGNPAPRFKLLAARRAFSRLRPTIRVASRGGKSRRFGRSARRPGLGVSANPGLPKGSVLKAARQAHARAR